MDTREYFIYLLGCHLNGVTPRGERRSDWQQIYNLANKNHVAAMVAYEADRLPEDCRPKGETLSLFRRSLGATKDSFDSRLCSMAILMSTLTTAQVPHLIIKGTALRNYYPVPALRTGSDIDVIVRPLDYIKAVEALKERGLEEISVKSNEAQLEMAGDIFEIRTELEHINIQSKIYFSTPFDDISDSMGYTYKLKSVYHLLYIITHIAHHLKTGGAGIRMIMDIDVLIRSNPRIDINEIMILCENIKIGKTAQALIALSKKWFNTPVALNFTFEDRDTQQLLKSLTAAILSGKVFGSAQAEENEEKPKCFILALLKKIFASNKTPVGPSPREKELLRELGLRRSREEFDQ